MHAPANILRPSFVVIADALPTWGAFLARYPATVTVSPSLSESRRQPRRIRPFGPANSKSQFTIFPDSSLTSTNTWAWGLNQSTRVTTPVTVTGLFRSNSASNEWCAAMDAAPSSRAPQTTSPRAPNARRHILIPSLRTLPVLDRRVSAPASLVEELRRGLVLGANELDELLIG